MKTSVATIAALAVAGLGAIVACVDPAPSTDPVGTADAELRTQFPPVALLLARRCGSIDCHGSTYRNFRVYGYGGTRLDAASGNTPETPQTVTPDEASATYEGLVSLEPEIMRDVIAAKGVGADRLTALRKARGDEDHKGEKLWSTGDDGDVCFTSWLARATDAAKCDAATKAK